MKHSAFARYGSAFLVGSLTLSLTAINFAVAQTPPATPQTSKATPTASLGGVPVLNAEAIAALQRAIVGRNRIEPSRDKWRNPAATLQFFGVRPTDTVIEIWPGQGWYTSILGPYLKQGGGNLVVGHFDAASTNSAVVRQIVDAYRGRFASDTANYGNVSVVPFGPRSGPLGLPNSVDSVLTFRNVHNWMAQNWAEKAFGDFYLVLKPGGILGIEEHRGRTDEPQDPLARDGYVREDYVIQLAREAGFEFVGRSEINANPADTKDHPFGVWTLQPVARTSPLGQRDDPGFDRTRFDAIGETDRMTLRFRKPLSATGPGPAIVTRPSPVIVNPALPAPPVTVRPVVPPPVVRVPPIVAPVVATPPPPPVVPVPKIVTPKAPPPPPTVSPPPPQPVLVSPPPAPILPPSPVVPQPETPRLNPDAVPARAGDPTPPLVLPRLTPAPPALPPPPPATAPVLPPAPPPPPPPQPSPLPPAPPPPPAVETPAPVLAAPPPPPPPPSAPTPAPAPPPPSSPAAAVAPIVRPAPPPPAVRPTPRQSPPPPAAVRPSPPPPAARSTPARTPAAATPSSRPTTTRPATTRPASPPATPVSRPKTKTKSPPPPAARAPAARSPVPPPKKKAPPPTPAPRNPNKPDWVVPRAKS